MEIIIPHINTDMDALGAAVGAQLLYPQATILLPGACTPVVTSFMSLHRYNLRIRMETPRDLSLDEVTRAIVVDTADRARLGPLQAVADSAEIHLFDHHPQETDDIPATLVVRDQVGATCTLIAELLEEAGVALTPLQATVMLLGIYADTGSLTFTGTTDRDARAAAYLLTQGASLRAMARFIQATLSPAQLDLLHQLQAGSKWLGVHRARIRVVEGSTAEYVGGLNLVVHRLQEILPTPVLFAVVRMGEKVYLVGRSDVPWVDVAAAMAPFGGGGHKSAASAVIKGQSTAEVLERLERVLNETVASPILARDVMSTPVKAISTLKPVADAERIMLRHGHSGLPVVDEAGRLVGVISLRDVENARRHGLSHAPVKGVMNHRVVTVLPETPLDEAQDLMVEKDIGRVPVVEGENLVGIISRSDLLGRLYGGLAPHWHRTIYHGSGDDSGLAPADPTAALAAEGVSKAPAAVRALLGVAGEVAERMGVAVYAVGGFVRDLLLGRPNLDLDLVVEGDGIAFAKALGSALWAVVNPVERFGTAHIFLQEPAPDLPGRIDVATARREFYEHAAALPLVEHADLREDLYRRDFTINALAIRLRAGGPGGLVDFYGGLSDLHSGQIRILHSLSFVEDPTRIVRAVRFAHRYTFQLEPETKACALSAIRDGYLDRISLERLRNELVLILKEERSGSALAAAGEMGLFERLLPGLKLDEADRRQLDEMDHLAGRMADLYQEAVVWLAKLLYLCRLLPEHEGVAAVLRLKLRRTESGPLLQALQEWRATLGLLTGTEASPAAVVGALAPWSPEGLLLLCALGASEPVLRYWRELRHVTLEINGDDLIGLGIPAGPLVGRILNSILTERLDGRAPDRQSQLALALRNAQGEL